MSCPAVRTIQSSKTSNDNGIRGGHISPVTDPHKATVQARSRLSRHDAAAQTSEFMKATKLAAGIRAQECSARSPAILLTASHSKSTAARNDGRPLSSPARSPANACNSWLRCLGRIGIAFLAIGVVANASAKTNLEAPIVVTQVPARIQTAPAARDATDLVRSDWFDGARLVVVSPAGQLRVLSEGFQSACDPNVSFDGQRVLFAGRKSSNERWRIWEIGVDGQGLRAVSPENLDARNPIHVSPLNTLEAKEPWSALVFVGRETTINEVGRASGSNLYNVRFDGTELRRLTFNPNHNLDPFQLWDGRVIYSAERHPNEPGESGGRVGLYAIHMEGADMEAYGGELGQRIQQMPCATAGGLVVFVESSQPSWDGAGQLACVEQRRPHATYHALTDDPAQVYRQPSPLQGNAVLVSRRATKAGANWGVFSFNAESRTCEPVFDSPEFHDVQAVIAKPRPRPDGHSTVVTTAGNFGTFYGMNCYTTDARRAAGIKPGEVKRVRLIEGILPSEADATRASHPRTPARAPYIPRRLVGEAPVEADGSFNVIVPADTPLLIQTLDERGLALGNCGWVWVKPKEVRGCIGCHEDPELVPENEYVQALRRPSNELLLPPDQRRRVAFREDIAPILQQHCATAGCHGGKDTPLHLPLLTAKPTERDLLQAYQRLTAPAGKSAKESPAWPAPGKYVDAGRARTSWLVWQIVGADTSRSWDRPEPLPVDRSRKVTRMPAHEKAAPLSPDEVRTVIEWIDLGAQFEAPQPSATKSKKESDAQ